MERLKEVEVDRRGWRAALARACEVSAPSVSDWFSGKTVSLEAKSLIKAAEFCGVRPYWLMTGKGPKFPDLKDWPFSQELLTAVKRLPETELYKAENMLRGYVGLNPVSIPENLAA